jgi:hypothetical protein
MNKKRIFAYVILSKFMASKLAITSKRRLVNLVALASHVWTAATGGRKGGWGGGEPREVQSKRGAFTPCIAIHG